MPVSQRLVFASILFATLSAGSAAFAAGQAPLPQEEGRPASRPRDVGPERKTQRRELEASEGLGGAVRSRQRLLEFRKEIESLHQAARETQERTRAAAAAVGRVAEGVKEKNDVDQGAAQDFEDRLLTLIQEVAAVKARTKSLRAGAQSVKGILKETRESLAAKLEQGIVEPARRAALTNGLSDVDEQQRALDVETLRLDGNIERLAEAEERLQDQLSDLELLVTDDVRVFLTRIAALNDELTELADKIAPRI